MTEVLHEYLILKKGENLYSNCCWRFVSIIIKFIGINSKIVYIVTICLCRFPRPKATGRPIAFPGHLGPRPPPRHYWSPVHSKLIGDLEV